METPQNIQYGQQMQVQPEERQCFSCYFEGVGASKECPRCHKKVFTTASSIRTRGLILVICGVILAGLMGMISIGVFILMAGAGISDPDSSRKIHETIPLWIAVFGLFAVLIVLGADFAIHGMYMRSKGRMNRVLLTIQWVLTVTVGVFAALLPFLGP